MKNTLKLFVAAFIVAIAASCGAKTESAESTEPTDTVTVETPAPVVEDTTTVPVDTTAVN